MGRYENNVQRAGDTLMSHARRPPCPRTQRSTVTLPLRLAESAMVKIFAVQCKKLYHCGRGQPTLTKYTALHLDKPGLN